MDIKSKLLKIIPSHWKVKRIKNIGNVNGGLTYSPENVVDFDSNNAILVLRSSNIQNGKISFLDNVYVNIPVNKKQITKVGDILICSRNGSRRLLGKNALIDESSKNLAFGAFMTILRTKNNKYIKYYLSSGIFDSLLNSSTSTINQLTTKDIKNIEVPIPSAIEQERIVFFLDENCSKIDSEISLLEKKSKLLEEYKQSLIFETVTKGLDKNAEMKDSGINWIGEIPKDKLLIRIKNILKQGIKSNIPASEKEEDGIYDFYLSGSNVKKSNNYITDKEILLLPDGGNFYVHYNKEKNKCAYSNHVIPYVNKKNFNLKYMYYFLISNKEILNNMLFNGIGIKNLDRKSFLDVFIVNFNRKEQENIVVFLDNETNKINKKIELINEKVELLKEYKQSLIYEAVTGQLEIE